MSELSSKPKILIVEDDAIVTRVVELQLAEFGYDIAGTATRGEQAIELAGVLTPDLVLMDIKLAGPMDGISAALVIRERFGLPIVFLTAFDADDVLARAKLSEPFGYILKPFFKRELRTVLVMALYKHQAEAKLIHSTRQLKALSQRLLEAQELERRRVAVELHDELGQSLTAIKINLQLRDRFEDKRSSELDAENLRIVEDALQQVRRLAMGLRPSLLDDLGLVPALQWMAEQNASRGDFALRFHFDIPPMRFPPEVETAFFRVAQEALTNIVRHGQAAQVAISLRHDGDTLVLCIQDDGRGFDPLVVRERAVLGGSMGVLGMQERAMLLGGRLEVQSAPGLGSTVQLSCPWRERLEVQA